MGCGVECPNIPIDEDWNLDDPLGQKRDFFRLIRDEIEKKEDFISRNSQI